MKKNNKRNKHKRLCGGALSHYKTMDTASLATLPVQSITDKKLIKIVKQFRRGMLGRKCGSKYCYMVCWPLQAYLGLLDFHTDLVEGDVCYYRYWIGHFWLRMDDGRIIDPTADQFSTDRRPMPEIYIGKKPRWYRCAK